MMFLLVNDVILNVKLGCNTGADIKTAIGICQGDYLSALLFILYLAYAIKQIPDERLPQDHQKHLRSALDWIINRDKVNIEIDPKYADDITFIRSEGSQNKYSRTCHPSNVT